MQKGGSVSRGNANSLRVSVPQQSSRRMGLCSTGVGQHPRIVFLEKRNINPTSVIGDDPCKVQSVGEHRIHIIGGGGGGDEKSDLLGYVVYNGKLALDKRKNADEVAGNDGKQNSGDAAALEGGIDAKITSKALVWGSNVLLLDAVISVSYHTGLRHFTVHAYPTKTDSCNFLPFKKGPKRSRKDFRFLTSSKEKAIHWVGGFADQQCYIN